MTFWISALLFVTGVGAGLRARFRRARKAKIARRRHVERPNSYYSAPGVRRMVDLERWERINRAELHPVNRDEVDRLLQQARTVGPDSLSAGERNFLDNRVPGS